MHILAMIILGLAISSSAYAMGADPPEPPSTSIPSLLPASSYSNLPPAPAYGSNLDLPPESYIQVTTPSWETIAMLSNQGAYINQIATQPIEHWVPDPQYVYPYPSGDDEELFGPATPTALLPAPPSTGSAPSC